MNEHICLRKLIVKICAPLTELGMGEGQVGVDRVFHRNNSGSGHCQALPLAILGFQSWEEQVPCHP